MGGRRILIRIKSFCQILKKWGGGRRTVAPPPVRLILFWSGMTGRNFERMILYLSTREFAKPIITIQSFNCPEKNQNQKFNQRLLYNVQCAPKIAYVFIDNTYICFIF